MAAGNTIHRINRISAERARLYGQAGKGKLGNPAATRRIGEINRELESLWARRRQERVGRREGIDLLVDRAYENLYGSQLDAVAPPPGGAGAEGADGLVAVQAEE